MKPNNSGIIQSIIFCVDCWVASVDGTVDIFCSTHILAAVRTANRMSPLMRSSQRKWWLKGTMASIGDQ